MILDRGCRHGKRARAVAVDLKPASVLYQRFVDKSVRCWPGCHRRS
jgi:hypothetical protein